MFDWRVAARTRHDVIIAVLYRQQPGCVLYRIQVGQKMDLKSDGFIASSDKQAR